MAKQAQKLIKVGVDLGTANLLVYVDGEGIIFNEPSVIAMEYATNDVIAAGYNAARMIGRGHHGIKIVSPLNQGVISDMDAAKKLLEIAVHKAETTDVNLKATTLLICAPSEVTQIEREALVDLAHNLGVPDVFIEEEVKAGGIGAGLDIYDSVGSMVIDIGGGSTDIGVLSLGDIVVSESIRIAGNYLDQEIINYLQYEKGILIGKKTAQRIKEEIGTLRIDLPEEKETHANGRDIVSGLPRRITVKQSEIRDIFLAQGPTEHPTRTIGRHHQKRHACQWWVRPHRWRGRVSRTRNRTRCPHRQESIDGDRRRDEGAIAESRQLLRQTRGLIHATVPPGSRDPALATRSPTRGFHSLVGLDFGGALGRRRRTHAVGPAG
jgi:rod shape-determining protein MreB